MKQSIPLEFETYFEGHSFLINYEAFKSGRNLLMSVQFHGYLLDTSELPLNNKELYSHIEFAMANNAKSHFSTAKYIEVC